MLIEETRESSHSSPSQQGYIEIVCLANDVGLYKVVGMGINGVFELVVT